jgi:uncharacterized protein HemX
MKALITTLIALVFLFTAPAFAKGPGGTGKGSQKREHIRTHRGVMGEKAGDKAVKIRKMEQKRLKRAEEKSKKAKKGLEKQREKKAEQVQKELGKGSEKGQEAREMRRKWWRFWEKKE